ncbi:MAG: hypothetical protein QOH13_915, partial [Thermoleophilaceae bacterium]|nr:hypothetical protein [Thermoleophilaceae bacterium]
MKRSLLLALLASLLVVPAADAKPKDRQVGDPQSPYAKCDNLDPAVCLQPFPNNLFTKPSTKTDTGLKVHFALTSTPRNVAGKPIQPAQWNRNDGFSPGSLITTFVPGLDMTQTHGVPINDLARTNDPDAAVVVIDAATLERNLIWTELDANGSPSTRNLIVRPARNFQEGHTYIVALRNLKDSGGSTIPAGDAFRGYRDGTTDDARTEHMRWIFSRLAKAGIRRHSLFLAWDFTVASKNNLSERMLHIRDDAFAQLGDTNLADLKVQGSAPAFKVTRVEASDGLARKVTGWFKVPCYISTPTCQPGGGFVYKPGTNEPMQIPGNTYTAKFVCNIPQSALAEPARGSLYGHGLFGSTGEVGQGQLKAFGNEHNMVFCGTTWAGMGCEIDDPPADQAGLQNTVADLQAGSTGPNCDIPNVVTAISDLSRFNTMIDRVQEGMLAFLYLGRLMAHPQGLVSDPAFQNAQGKPVIATGTTYYDGNSQGGIIGGALAAVMVDSNRASIGVPGMNYSTLLQRSTDFGRGTDDECPPARMPSPSDPTNLPSYACLVYKAYPNEHERQLVFGLMQMLWDRGEADGYAWHMTTDPY